MTRKPTKAALAAAYGRTIDDVLAPGLDVVFVGINPSLYSGATGHHFARPGNRFWKALHQAGFTPRVLDPSEERELLRYGCGVTNVVQQATARADELTHEQIVAGAQALRRKLEHYHPHGVAFLGVTTYRKAFGDKSARIGKQPHDLAGAHLWVMPNPSGLNAHYQLDDLARLYAQVRRDAGRGR